ncbi:MAG: peptidylprolyl isomerase [Bacteroidota bacterium]
MKRMALLLTALLTIGMMSVNQAQQTKVKMKTSMGDVTILLYDDTPIHKDNFIDLVTRKVYDGVLFHRVIPEFMIQAGDPDSKNAKPGQQLGLNSVGKTIPAEFKPNHIHKSGALAAARQPDKYNPKKESSGSQFYIVTGRLWSLKELERLEQGGLHPKFTADQKNVYTTIGGYPPLDYQYTVFGEVTEGMDIVKKIGLAPRDTVTNLPKNDIKIISMTIVK